MHRSSTLGKRDRMLSRLSGVRQILKLTYFNGAVAAGLDRMLIMRHGARGSVLVLNFHRIAPQRNPYWPAMTPTQFQELLRFLQARARVVTFAELNYSPSKLPQVILSFDDGCRDFVQYALPILDAHGVRANQNIVANAVERGETPWMIKLVDAMAAAPSHRILALELPSPVAGADLSSDAAKARFGARLTGCLKALTPAQRERHYPDLTSFVRDADPAVFTPMMSRKDVQSALTLCEWGAHSLDHETMSLLDQDAFGAQIRGCKAFMQALGLSMTIFAFPYGSYRADQIDALRREGVSHILLVQDRPNTFGTDVYSRITMYGDSSAELRLRAVGHHRPLAHHLANGQHLDLR